MTAGRSADTNGPTPRQESGRSAPRPTSADGWLAMLHPTRRRRALVVTHHDYTDQAETNQRANGHFCTYKCAYHHSLQMYLRMHLQILVRVNVHPGSGPTPGGRGRAAPDASAAAYPPGRQRLHSVDNRSTER